MKNRKKISFIFILVTLILAAIILILPVDQILTGYSVRNGVETITYVPKMQGIGKMAVIQIAVCLMWNYCSNRMEKKAEAEPELVGYRVKTILLDVYFCIMNSVGAMVGIINIVLWLKNLL